MKSFREFIAEAARRRLKADIRYHGTTKSRASEIKSSGFKGSEGILGYGVYSTPFRKEAEFHARRHAHDSDPPSLIKLRSFRGKNKKHHIHARNMYDKITTKDPFKKDITKRIKDRAQAHLEKGRDVVVTNTTDKSGKVIGKEIIQNAKTATKDIIHKSQPTIKATGRPRRTRTQPKKR